MPGSDGRSGIVGIVFGYEVFAGEVVTQGPDDLGDSCGVDGLYGVEAEPVDAEVAQIHAGVVEKEVFDLSLPGREAFTPGSVMAVDVVDAAGYSVIAGAVAVVLPVTVVELAGVIVDDVKDYGEAQTVRCIDQLDEFGDRLVGGGGVQVFARKHVRGAVALAGSARGVGLEVRDGQEFDGIEAQVADVWQPILEVNEG